MTDVAVDHAAASDPERPATATATATATAIARRVVSGARPAGTAL
jgi:hypothetical protein